MANLHDPRIAITGTVKTEGLTMDGHTHASAPKLSGSDAQLYRSGPPDMCYNEKQLVNLIKMMHSAMTGGHDELPVIASTSKYAYPAFSKALEDFSKGASLQAQESIKDSDRMELYQRLFNAEQQKTQALLEFNDI